jgi:hypothetical protein
LDGSIQYLDLEHSIVILLGKITAADQTGLPKRVESLNDISCFVGVEWVRKFTNILGLTDVILGQLKVDAVLLYIKA